MAGTLFYILMVCTIGFSLLVILLRSPITSTFALVASFFCVAGLYVLLEASFLAVMQVLIYAGAVLVLFLYVLMLLNLRHIELKRYKHDSMRRCMMILTIPVVVILFLLKVDCPDFSQPDIGNEFGTIASIGGLLLGEQAILFELLSVVLLAAILGVVLLGAKQKDEER